MPNKKKTVEEYKELTQEQFGDLLKKTAEEMHVYAKDPNHKSPMQYMSDKLQINASALNSYYFTQYSVFQRDIKDKINPYIAFTIAIIHALNIGFELGKLEGKHGHTSDSSK